MITRVYFLKVRQANRSGGVCHSFRTLTYVSCFPPKLNDVVNTFLDEASKSNELPSDGWILESFSKVK